MNVIIGIIIIITILPFLIGVINCADKWLAQRSHRQGESIFTRTIWDEPEWVRRTGRAIIGLLVFISMLILEPVAWYCSQIIAFMHGACPYSHGESDTVSPFSWISDLWEWVKDGPDTSHYYHA